CRPLLSECSATIFTSTLSLHDALPISACLATVAVPVAALQDEKNRDRDRAKMERELSDLQSQRAKLKIAQLPFHLGPVSVPILLDRKSTRLNSSHSQRSDAVSCLKNKI